MQRTFIAKEWKPDDRSDLLGLRGYRSEDHRRVNESSKAHDSFDIRLTIDLWPSSERVRFADPVNRAHAVLG
ncbi:MAG: hypothetical protein OXI44_04545 [Bacteroidota bacterium]|nr:hypothetical protein [Bacteroidota bacterium]